MNLVVQSKTDCSWALKIAQTTAALWAVFGRPAAIIGSEKHSSLLISRDRLSMHAASSARVDFAAAMDDLATRDCGGRTE